VITKEILDKSLEGGCEMAGCGHNHDTMFLHSRCHTDAPQFLWKREDGIVSICVHPRCNKPVIGVKPKEEKLPEGACFDPLFKAACHPHSAIQLEYTRGSGVLKIKCYECEETAGELVIE